MVISEAELIRMKNHLTQIPDPRRQWGNLRHKLVDILIIALCTVIIREDEFDAMEDWGLEREDVSRPGVKLTLVFHI